MGGVKNKWGSNIYYYITTLSILHFFRNSKHPEKWSVSFKDSLEICNASVVTSRFLKFIISVLENNF